MENKYEEKDIEKQIFQTALGDIQIQPSEKFWNAALNSIIDREKALARKSTIAWRNVSFILGACLALFCIHEVWTYNRMKSMQQEISAIKNSKYEQVNASVVAANSITSTNDIHEESAAKENPVIQNTGSINGSTQKAKIKKTVALTNGWNAGDQVTSTIRGINTSMQQSGTSVSNMGQHSNAKNTNNGVGENNEAVGNVGVNALNNQAPVSVAGNVNSIELRNNVTVNTEQKQAANDAGQKDTTHTTAAIQAVADTAGSGLLPVNEPPKPKIDLSHKFKVSAFFAPGGISDFLEDKDNNTNDNITVNSLKNEESDLFSYETGIKIGLDLSDRFSLLTGLYSYVYTYNINQSIITAQLQRDGSIGYTIVTSSGIVNIPYPSSTKIGDSLKVRGSSTRSYLCIPLQLAYTFAAHNRMAFYIVGGTSLNILSNSVTSLGWQNTFLQQGFVTVQNNQGIASVELSYSLGLGATYKVWRGFSVFIEPYLQGSITSISKNAPITIYPYFLGCAGGITYHF